MMQRATLPALFLLAACGGGTGIPTTVSETVDAVGMPAGTLEGETPYSGIAFATAATTSDDFEGISIPVKMVQWHRDRSTRAVTLQISEETVILAPGYYRRSFGNAVITLNGETYALTGYSTEHGGKWFQHAVMSYGSERSVVNRHELTVAVDGGIDQFWDSATFLIGAETDPAWVAAKDGSVSYDGWFFVNGFASYSGGTASDQYRNVTGQVGVVVDFDTNMVTGEIDGYVTVLNETATTFDDNLFARIEETPLLGNGFEAPLIFDSCPGYSSCDAGNSRLSGALYGDEGKQLTGLILFDADFTKGGTDARLSGPGWFYANPATE